MERNRRLTPQNVTCRHDIPVDEFLNEMASSEVVCLPLDTEAPAGLIVLFQAAAMNKPIVTSDTVTTRGYITDKISNARLVASKNPLKWADTIRRSTSCKTSSGHSLRNYLRNNCNSDSFVGHLSNIISGLQK